MTKGLIGLLIPSAVILLWALVFNKWKALWPFYPLVGFPVFFAITVPWHLLAWKANPGFAWFYFVDEHFLRYLTMGHGRYQPFWFFFAILLVGLFPWVGFLFAALSRILSGAGGQRIKERPGHVFLIIWVLFVLLFFSASKFKLIPYILPVFPALSLLIGDYLSNTRGPSRVNYKAAPNALALSVVASVILFIGVLVALLMIRRRADESVLLVPLITMLVFSILLNPQFMFC